MGGRLLTAGLSALCLALAAAIYGVVGDMPSRSATAGPAPSIARSAPGNESAEQPVLPPIEAFRDMVDRPLFNPTRRPIAAVAARPDRGSTAATLNVMLSGIVINGDRRFAHLYLPQDRRVRVLSVGDAVDGWRIQSILPDRIRLSSGAATEEIVLQDAHAASRPAPANPGSSK